MAQTDDNAECRLGGRTPCKILSVPVPILEMQKLRHTEFKVLIQLDTHQVCVTPKAIFILHTV